jgi:hypothetical protein
MEMDLVSTAMHHFGFLIGVMYQIVGLMLEKPLHLHEDQSPH